MRDPSAQLAERLSRPGPRYTSYPTAAQFHAGFGEAEHRAALAASNEGARPLSLYVHVPFCETLCHYCGCHVKAGVRPERVARYLDALITEVAEAARHVDPARPVVQVHWGGGTPTTLGPAGIARLMAVLRHYFGFAADAEVSLEADPRTLTRETLAAARRAGFDRLSFGVQDFDPAVQVAIGRIQPYERVAEVVQDARALGFGGLSFDLIYGLPHQTEARWAETLRRVRVLRPDRMSVFGYAHVPWMKRQQRLLETSPLPDPALRLRLFDMAREALTGAGYRFIGLDHFALPEDPLARARDEGTLQRNFQGYSTHAGADLLGFGVSAISAFDGAYAQNTKGLVPYYRALDAGRLPTERGLALTDEDRLRRHVIERIMCDGALDKRAVEARFGVAFDDHFAGALDALAALEADGLVVLGPGGLTVTEAGRPFVRHVAMAFDAYLAAAPAAAPRYSQTV